MRTRTTVACLCAAALVGITALANADLIAPKRPVLQDTKTQPTPPKTNPPDANKPASDVGTSRLDERCAAVKERCIEHCCKGLPTKDCGFSYWNCQNECMAAANCFGASKK